MVSTHTHIHTLTHTHTHTHTHIHTHTHTHTLNIAGTEDVLVSVRFGKASRDFIGKDLGVPIDFATYDGLGHGVADEVW